jgi:uncharacterized membrane protein YgdD (TMEM256/DUF423 family)
MTTSVNRSRTVLVAAGFFGLTGVAFGALGAHGLAERLSAAGMLHGWETAARYHLFHALALLAAGVWLRTASGNVAALVAWAARCWIVGLLLFAGSLYGLALGGPRFLGPITPLGGLALMAGWSCVLLAAFVREE